MEQVGQTWRGLQSCALPLRHESHLASTYLDQCYVRRAEAEIGNDIVYDRMGNKWFGDENIAFIG